VKLQTLSTDFGERFAQATSRLNAQSTPGELSAAIEEVEAVAADTAASLERIEPPQQAADAHGRLIAAFAAYAADLRTARRSGDAAATATEFQGASAQFQEELSAAANQLERAGLEVSEPAQDPTATETAP
jgi:hypothetical protein